MELPQARRPAYLAHRIEPLLHTQYSRQGGGRRAFVNLAPPCLVGGDALVVRLVGDRISGTHHRFELDGGLKLWGLPLQIRDFDLALRAQCELPSTGAVDYDPNRTEHARIR